MGRSTGLRWLPVAAALLYLTLAVERSAAQAPTATPPILIIGPTRTPTRTPGSIVLPPTATRPGSGPPTWTSTPTRTASQVPSPTPTQTNVVELVPTDLPLTLITSTPTPFSLTLPTHTPTDLPLIGDQPPDLILWGLEVTQGMQDLANRMPLVASRRTYARVFVYTDVGDLPNVMGALAGWRDGQPLPGSPLFPENGPITAHPDGGERTALDDSLYFYLPPAWRTGEVILKAFVYSGYLEAPFEMEPEADNNFRETAVEFHEADEPGLHLYPLHAHVDYTPDSPELVYDGSAAGPIVADIYRLLPIAAVDIDVSWLTLFPPDHANGEEWDLGPCRTTLSQDISPANLSFRIEDDSTVEVGDFLQIGLERMEVTLLSAGNIFVDRGASGTSVGEFYPEGSIVHLIRCNSPTDDLGDPNTVLALIRALFGYPESDLLYGMVDPLQPFGPFRGMADGDGNAMGWMDGTVSADFPWHIVGGSVLAHEVAHNTGLLHVGCKDDNEDGIPDEVVGGAIDPNHPTDFPNCSLAPVDPLGFFGFDVYWELWPALGGPTVISNDPNFPAPNSGYPLMGYRGAKWPDAYDYCLMLDYFGVPCSPADIGFGGDEGPGLPGSQDLTGGPDPFFPPDEPLALHVAGTIDPQAGTGQIDQTFSLPEPLPAAPPEDQAPHEGWTGWSEYYRLSLEDRQGNVLAWIPLAEHSASHEPVDMWSFSARLPLPPGAAHLRLWQGDRLLAERTVSANGPTAESFRHTWDPARGTLQLDWAASDPDGDALAVMIEVSVDEGQTWKPAWVFGTELPPVQVLPSGLPASERALLRLTVSDGFHADSLVSEPLAIPDSPPPIWILTPIDGTTLPSGARVTLQGAAGAEVGEQAQVQWHSDRDGILGEGWEVSTRSLSPGLHEVTLSVTNARGTTSQVSVSVAIDPEVVRATAEPGWSEGVIRLLETGQPESEVITRLRSAGLGLALASSALLGVGGLVLLLRGSTRRKGGR